MVLALLVRHSCLHARPFRVGPFVASRIVRCVGWDDAVLYPYLRVRASFIRGSILEPLRP